MPKQFRFAIPEVIQQRTGVAASAVILDFFGDRVLAIVVDRGDSPRTRSINVGSMNLMTQFVSNYASFPGTTFEEKLLAGLKQALGVPGTATLVDDVGGGLDVVKVLRSFEVQE